MHHRLRAAGRLCTNCGHLWGVCKQRCSIPRTLETLFVRQVKNNKNAHGTTVVRCCDGAESLLSSGVPLRDG